MSEVIKDGKFVELTYKVTDKRLGHVLTRVEFPLGYVHGHNEILAPSVHQKLEGRSAGDTVEVVIAPILLGAGLPLYPGPAATHQLTLTSHRVFDKTGLLMLEYAISR